MTGAEAPVKGYPPPDASTGPNTGGKPLLAEGCYFLAYGRDVEVSYVGTLRAESRNGQLKASADLYAFDAQSVSDPQPIGLVPPPGSGIPIFPIADYTYYLRVTAIAPVKGGFDLSFEAYRFVAKVTIKLDRSQTPEWVLDGAYKARLLRTEAPPGYPEPDRFFAGTVFLNPEDPEMTAQIQMGWVSPLLRRAAIEIDRVPETKVPQDSGVGATWQSVFRSFGWDVDVIVSDDNITRKTGDGPVWRGFDVQATLEAHRDSSDLDTEWRFYILITPQIFAPGEAFGFMYHPKREALFIGAQRVFAENEPQWGPLRGQRFDATVAFFRCALHEMGHAMGLVHNEAGFHIMRPTESIAAEAPADKPFPTNIAWSFDPADTHRLRHWPDIAVRPGGGRGRLGDALPFPDGQRF